TDASMGREGHMREQEIVIRLRVPRWPRRRWLVGGAAAVMLTGAIAFAAVTWPSSHSAGTKLSGADLDAYLNDLNTRVAAMTTLPTWTALTGKNGWVSHGGGDYTPSYSKTPNGIVHLRGLFASGTFANGTIMATLPSGYHPASLMEFAMSAPPAAG